MRRITLLFALTFVFACSESTELDDAGTEDAEADTMADSGGEDVAPDVLPDTPVDPMPMGPPTTIGGERPARVVIPNGYDESEPTPLIFLLHGLGATGSLQDGLFQMANATRGAGVLLVIPEGTSARGRQFWNATDVCCDFANTGVDDSGYLGGLIDEMEAEFNVDPARIYFTGHSNGGFMSYRMACDHADRIAAIAGLAGATYVNAEDCGATEPVSVLQIHGDADSTVPVSAGVDSATRWAERAGCDLEAAVTEEAALDLAGTDGSMETTTKTYSEGCDAGHEVALWTMVGEGHIPGLNPDFSHSIVEWLLAHPRQ